MTFSPMYNWSASVTNIIHAGTQQHENHFDLTVAEVHKFTKAGSLDFGGSEFKAADVEKVKRKKMDQDDKYGWWKLEQGTYKIIFNEGLKDQKYSAVISAHEHARAAGLILSTTIISPDDDTGHLSTNVTVPVAGCNIKENARIATLRMMS
jgi:hypothetical protein